MASSESENQRVKLKFSEIPAKAKWLIYLTSFSAIGFGYLIITVTAYYPKLGFDVSDIGLIVAVSGAASVLTAIPMGIYADRHGRKLLFIFGLFSIPPMLLVFAFTTDVTFLLIAAIGAGIGEGAFMACWNALIADMTPPENRTAAFSLSFIVNSAASALGFLLPVAFPYIESSFNVDALTVHSAFFVIVAVVALVSPVSLSLLLRGYREVITPGRKLTRGKHLGTVLKFSGCSSLIGLGAGFIIPLIPTWLFLKWDVQESASGPLLALANLLMALAAMVNTSLAVRYGPVKAIVLTQGIATILMFTLAYASNELLAGVIYLFRAALMNMASPIADSYLMGIISPEERGFASSLNAIVWRLPNNVSTVIGGQLLDAGNFYMPFFLATSFYGISTTAFFVLFRKVKPIS